MTEELSSTITIPLQGKDEALGLLGARDQHLRILRESLGVRIIARGDTLQIDGDSERVVQAEAMIQQLRKLLAKHGHLSQQDVHGVVNNVLNGTNREPETKVAVVDGGKHIRPRTEGQTRYVNAMRENDLVMCIGPAGTGKTYLAVAMAVNLLRQKTIRRIILVRPAVEAGERLGFLPGDLAAKINPYLRPLFDSLADLMEPEQLKRYLENDIIEILPLAYMRGRTLNNALIILDEGQNATVSQMKMFLTRMGNNSKIIITGDVTQVDLPKQTRSGLMDALKILQNVPGIGVVHLGQKDIVRHPLVQRIVRAYEEAEKEEHRDTRE